MGTEATYIKQRPFAAQRLNWKGAGQSSFWPVPFESAPYGDVALSVSLRIFCQNNFRLIQES